MNGDGFGDIILGDPDHFSGDGGAFIYLGSPAGPEHTPFWSAVGNQRFARFGNAVASAGDTDGDGKANVLVGAFQLTNGEGAEGAAFLYFGPVVVTCVDQDGDGWGAPGSLACPQGGLLDCDDSSVLTYPNAPERCDTADNDCDGAVDEGLGVGSACMAGTGTCSIAGVLACTPNGAVCSGPQQGTPSPEVCDGLDNDCDGAVDEGLASPDACTIIATPARQSFLGASVASAGDTNHDGFDDLIVGAPSSGLDQGRAFLFFGAASGDLRAPDWTTSVTGGVGYGRVVSGAGDVNGDGFDEAMVGFPGFSSEYPGTKGAAYLFAGSTSGPAPTATQTFVGPVFGEELGGTLAHADVNGDGFSDLMVGSPGHPDTAVPPGYSRHVSVFHGGSAWPAGSPNAVVSTDQSYSEFAKSLASAGDVNGDGYEDVVIGAPSYDHGPIRYAGRLYVYFGSPSGLVVSSPWFVDGDTRFGSLGLAVASAGDANGDGYGDLLASSRTSTGGGRVWLFLGSATGPRSSPAWTLDGDQIDSRFGAALASAGDINGDGYGDVVIGAPYYDHGQTDEGRVFLYLGTPVGLAVRPSWTAEIDQASAHFGSAVAGAGDLNGDGVSDLAVGAPDFDSGGSPSAGRIDLFLSIVPDCNGNGRDDAADIALGGSVDCDGNGLPDECDRDCDGNQVADICEVASGAAPDCDHNGVPDRCDIASGGSRDCNDNGVPDSCDLANGDLDANQNGVPDECDDCNDNGTPDAQDILAGASMDCNANLTPDECDLGAGTSRDCNGNAFPDECDTAFGASHDCNANAIPDDCELADLERQATLSFVGMDYHIWRSSLDGSSVRVFPLDPVSGFPTTGVVSSVAYDAEGGTIYWTATVLAGGQTLTGDTGVVRRARVDGTGLETLFNGFGMSDIELDLLHRHIYVTRGGAGSFIQRANFDGSGVVTVLSGLNNPTGLALDVAGNKMYWMDDFGHSVRRANLDGTGVDTLFSSAGYLSSSGPYDLALDTRRGKIYFRNSAIVPPKMFRANLDGTGLETFLDLSAPDAGGGLTVDADGLRIYWWSTGKIQRVRLDGSGVETVLSTNPSAGQVYLSLAPARVTDCNANGVPDSCESRQDADSDGILDLCDNCPTVANPDQEPCACMFCGARDITISFSNDLGHGSGTVFWSTSAEFGFSGFNIVVMDNQNRRVQLNPVLIPCEECITGLGRSYSYVVPKHKSGHNVFIEVVRRNGTTALYGPAQKM